MKLIRIWGQMQRPWGYEIRADYDDDGKIVNAVFGFDKEPDQKAIDLKVAEEMTRLEVAKTESNEPELGESAEVIELRVKVAELEKQVAELTAIKVIK